MNLIDPVRYAWANENVLPKVVNGKIVWVKRLSGYAFRKSRATWYAMACLEKGIQDVLLCTAHFLGHGSKSIGSTYKYVKSLIADSIDGVRPFKAPDLNVNLLGPTQAPNASDRIISLLMQDIEFREYIAGRLKIMNDKK
jgi:hypothetical protein